MTKAQARSLAYTIARKLGVRRKLKSIRFREVKVGWCCPDDGIIEYPLFIFKTCDAYIVHFVIHEVLHLKYPDQRHDDPMFRKLEESFNKRYGLRLIFKGAYAMAIYNAQGDLLYKDQWAKAVCNAVKETTRDRRSQYYKTKAIHWMYKP